MLQRQERHQEADQAYRRALALQPDNPETLTNYGTFLQDRGDVDAARDCFTKAIRMKPRREVRSSDGSVTFWKIGMPITAPWRPRSAGT